MKRSIRSVAVLGSGVMGSRIAAHFAGVGLQVLLLDIQPKDLPENAPPAARNKIVNDALAAALRGPGSASERLRNGLEQFAARAWHSRRLAFALIAEPVDPEVDEQRLLYREAYAELFSDLLEEGAGAAIAHVDL